MKDLKRVNKSESVTVRLSKEEAIQLQNEAANELLSISALVRRKIYFNPLKAAV